MKNRTSHVGVVRPHVGPRVRTALVGLALLSAAACSSEPSDVPVRTVTASGSWTAPSSREAAERDMALLRVVATVPGASRLDLSIGTQKVAPAVEYKAITPYGAVASGRQTLTLRPAGLDTAEPLAEQTETLRAGEHYTVLITPGQENGPAAAIRVLADSLNALDQNRATLRIVHAAADAGRLDAYITGRAEAIAQSLEFQQASDVTELQPGSVAIELRPAERTETMLRLPGQQVSPGGSYTVVVIGRTRIDPPLEYLVLEDRLTGG